ncbi:MAG: twin-arginine translocation signal domain-containing protein [Proteobacteria bacterium]|nr:twin-arginine translocation signal domain-containing protein [Pseudomonadota bacterium]
MSKDDGRPVSRRAFLATIGSACALAAVGTLLVMDKAESRKTIGYGKGCYGRTPASIQQVQSLGVGYGGRQV